MARLPRIVSLLPGATETVCALGLRDALVGVSHECDFPDGVRGLPVLTAPAIDPSLGSREIDRDVRERLSSGLSIYRVDEDLLERLAPDLVVTQDQCEVCAVSPRDLEVAVNAAVTLQRPPRPEEQQMARQFLTQKRMPLEDFCKALLNRHEFVYIP